MILVLCGIFVVYSVSPVELEFFTLEGGTDKLSRYIGKKLALLAG